MIARELIEILRYIDVQLLALENQEDELSKGKVEALRELKQWIYENYGGA